MNKDKVKYIVKVGDMYIKNYSSNGYKYCNGLYDFDLYDAKLTCYEDESKCWCYKPYADILAKKLNGIVLEYKLVEDMER